VVLEADADVIGHINAAIVKAVDEDYRKLLMNAYDPSEYVYYSEAHIPKLSHEFTSSGEYVERLPHIHIVIPMRNMVDGKYLNPAGFGEMNIRYLDAIQEQLNSKYSLRSPKSVARVAPTDSIERHALTRSDYPKAIVSQIESGKVRTFEDLQTFLEQYGRVVEWTISTTICTKAVTDHGLTMGLCGLC
jgi:hypothetical protein